MGHSVGRGAKLIIDMKGASTMITNPEVGIQANISPPIGACKCNSPLLENLERPIDRPTNHPTNRLT